MYCSVYVFHPVIALLCIVLVFDPSYLKAGANMGSGRNSPANGLMKIAEKQFFVYWDEFHILDSLFLKVCRVFFFN